MFVSMQSPPHLVWRTDFRVARPFIPDSLSFRPEVAATRPKRRNPQLLFLFELRLVPHRDQHLRAYTELDSRCIFVISLINDQFKSTRHQERWAHMEVFGILLSIPAAF